MVQNGKGLGETWAKMLTVCIDLAYPGEKLLESECDVGTGAAAPLKALLPKESGAKSYADKKAALTALLKSINEAKSEGAKHFWKKVKQVEGVLLEKFGAYKLVSPSATRSRGA
jgi:hypothetical protein